MRSHDNVIEFIYSTEVSLFFNIIPKNTAKLSNFGMSLKILSP